MRLTTTVSPKASCFLPAEILGQVTCTRTVHQNLSVGCESDLASLISIIGTQDGRLARRLGSLEKSELCAPSPARPSRAAINADAYRSKHSQLRPFSWKGLACFRKDAKPRLEQTCARRAGRGGRESGRVLCLLRRFKSRPPCAGVGDTRNLGRRQQHRSRRHIPAPASLHGSVLPCSERNCGCKVRPVACSHHLVHLAAPGSLHKGLCIRSEGEAREEDARTRYRLCRVNTPRYSGADFLHFAVPDVSQ
jgi:hypothetical protein